MSILFNRYKYIVNIIKNIGGIIFPERTDLQLIYDGKALENHEIDPTELSSALLGFNCLLEEANKVLNDNRTKIKVKVKASFETGCFKINFTLIQDIIGAVQTLHNQLEPIRQASDILYLLFSVKGLSALIKFLKGKRPKRIYENEDGTWTVYRDEEKIEFEKEVIKLYQSFKLRKRFELLTSPLKKEGIDDCVIKINNKEECYCVMTKEEYGYFICPPSKERKLDTNSIRFETNITIVNLSFEEGKKWFVNDGQSNFKVQVEDEQFLQEIEEGREFGKDDLLKVRMRREQFYQEDENKLKLENYIEKVIEHKKKKKMLQSNLFQD